MQDGMPTAQQPQHLQQAAPVKTSFLDQILSYKTNLENDLVNVEKNVGVQDNATTSNVATYCCPPSRGLDPLAVRSVHLPKLTPASFSAQCAHASSQASHCATAQSVHLLP